MILGGLGGIHRCTEDSIDSRTSFFLAEFDVLGFMQVNLDLMRKMIHLNGTLHDPILLTHTMTGCLHFPIG